MKNQVIQKMVFSFLIILSSFANSLFAQPDPAARQEKMLARMQESLDLSDEQTTQVKQLQDKYFEKFIALRQDETLSQDEKRSQFKTLRKTQEEELKSILNEDQWAQYQSFQAERRGRRGQGRMNRRAQLSKEDRKALSKEMKAYYQNNIQPVILEQRAKLEADLDANSKATIQEARVGIKALVQEKKEARKALKGQEPETRREAMMAIRKEFKEGYKVYAEDLKAIASQYESNIANLYTEIADQEATWKTDMQAITEKYIPAENRPKNPRKGFRGGKGTKPLRSPIKFLLLDPNKNQESFLNEDDMYDELLTAIYPNPAVANNTIQWEMKNGGQVKIDLYNDQGSLVKSVFSGYKNAGEHEVTVDTGNLQNATYYYVIEQNGVKQTEPLIVQK